MLNKLKDENTYSNIFRVLAMIVFLGLFCAGLIFTGRNHEIMDEYVTLEYTNPASMFVILVLGFLFFLVLSKLYDKYLYRLNRAAVLALFCVISFVIAVLYALSGATLPQADALSIIEVAQNAASEAPVAYEYDSYICVYSQQLGFVSFIRILFAIFGNENYNAVRIVFSLFVPLTMLSGTGIIRNIITSDEKLSGKSEFIFEVLCLLCVPLYFYVPFVYGDLPYAALSMTAAWILLSTLNTFLYSKAFLFGIVCSVCYLMKANSLIVLVAFAIVLVISALNHSKRKAALFMLVFMAVMVTLVPMINDALYVALLPNNYDSMPSVCWVAMGMNDDYSRAGWNNFGNLLIFAEADYNAALAKQEALSNIKAVLGVWAHNPVYFLDFMLRKINLQWNTPMYQSIVMNNRYVSELQWGMGKLVYDSKDVRIALDRFMKAYQLGMYMWISAALLSLRKKKIAISSYVLLIAVFGGFLFSLVWEAKTRYIFPYLIFMIPYYAMAIALLMKLRYEADDAPGWIKFDFPALNLSLDKLKEGPEYKFHALDLMKFAMALCVIAIHTVPYMYCESKVVVRVVESVIFVSVPFFFITAGFLLGRKVWLCESVSGKLKIVRAYLVRMIMLYVIWSVVYLPLAISEYVRNNYSVAYSVRLYLRGFFFLGEHYNSWILWYILSSIFALILLMLFIKLKAKPQILIAIGFLGLLISGFIERIYETALYAPRFQGLFAFLNATFLTARVLKGIFYLPLGFAFAATRPGRRSGIIIGIVGFMLSLTGLFGDVAVAICSIGVFLVASSIELKASLVYSKLRRMSTVMYFVHMWVWTGYYMLVSGYKTYGIWDYVATAVVSTLIAWVYVTLMDKKKH